MKRLFLPLFALTVIAVAVATTLFEDPQVGAKTSENAALFDIDYSEMRIENEDKLVVPVERTEEVWNYLLEHLVDDKSFIKGLDPALDSYWYDELFTDVYYDTPDLIMLRHQSGIRHRKRVNLTDPEHEKSGRELMQIKLNDVDSNVLNRGEIKFKINREIKFNDPDDLHPVLRLVKPSDRPEFKQVLSRLGIDPYSLRKVLVIEQRRRSIYIPRDGEQFISIRMDEVTSKLLWVEWRHVEIEPELNEVPYTEADSAGKAYMGSINTALVEDILQTFPYIKRDLAPKYNKAFAYFESKIPLLRFLIKNKLIH